MEDPKTVVKQEPRKSLVILFLSAVYSIIIGAVVLIGLGSGNSQMAEGAGWVMIACGLASLVYYILARKQEPPLK
ncbi:hypothetical protein [Marinobacter persicus]|jgi:uncharacterized membrane protein HdeD (DUF308 family)|uniref:Uncharacterized protein n=1 Tax=Marinobacter persicus TaxID=930118 RepID=A0A2S6G9Z2_9GAMM|nr:hypothetical protein [Marinobacter persicus]PPK53103.1 hypothetical protein BY455_103177 [Marinobacter persicus]PPK55980.1 hypothetical protein B0H24_1003177 [Marinobacter persicus]PPK59576.1 hypothetical protein BY454_103178 [Marinobacter persicus]